MKIWAHTLVQNEERYIWYAVMSVIDYVDKILIWDTGSKDNTVRIIKELFKLYPEKIEIREVGEVDIGEYTKARQEMLDKTKANWMLVLDGDEIWWDKSIKKLIGVIRSNFDKKLESIVTPSYVLIGDIYHYQEEKAGRYSIDGRTGHLTIRAINRNIAGLHTDKPHGQHGYFDGEGVLIQDRPKNTRKYLDEPYLHFTHLVRSSSRTMDLKVPKRDIKKKYELGKSFALDFYYPEVFFRPRPTIVKSPWETMDKQFFFKASLLTIPRKLKRRIIKGNSGY